jgi:hypothetical protein
MMQNNALHQACEAWLRDVLSFLQSKCDSINDFENVSQDNGWQEAALHHDYFLLYAYSMSEIVHFPTFNNLVDIIRRTPKLLSSLCVDKTGKPILFCLPHSHDMIFFLRNSASTARGDTRSIG